MKYLFKILLLISFFDSHAYAQEVCPAVPKLKEDTVISAPLFQFSGGIVYSSIDLSRYINSVTYRGYHARLVTHIYRSFFLSTEYSIFPEHNSSPAWENIHTYKIDVNGHISFSTRNKNTWIFVLAGLNKHTWTATRTGIADMNQRAVGIRKGTIVHVNNMGINFGCGFNQILYENIGLFGDFRFCFTNAEGNEKIRIMDVMTTIGINYSIPCHSAKSKKNNKTIGKKIYKWTKKAGK